MRNQKGIALMMAISALMLLSMIVLEFVFNSNVNYQIAINAKERLQAYYLAQSALNLMKVELKLDKQIKSQVASLPIPASSLAIDLSQPICQQYPFSTGLIRGFFIGGEMPLMKGSEPKVEGEEKPEAPPEEKTEKGTSVTAFETENAQEFLSFEGDFEGSCLDEASKFNLNIWAALDPGQQLLAGNNPYDMYKITFASFLKQERFKKLFEGYTPDKIDEVVRNIADWVDKNDVINDLGGMTRGQEDSLYREKDQAKPKNGKFLTLDELHLVQGVEDRWFVPIEDMLTVYGGSQINVCLAESDIIWPLVLNYAAQMPNIPVINPKNEELKKKILDQIALSCSTAQPQANKIAADVDTALGITGVQQNPGQQQSGGGFAQYITTEPRYYSLKLTGQVNNTMVNIKVVLDIKDNDPKKWRLLYYKVL